MLTNPEASAVLRSRHAIGLQSPDGGALDRAQRMKEQLYRQAQPLPPVAGRMRHGLLLARTLPLVLVLGLVCAAASHAQSTQWTTFSYDALGRVTLTKYPDGTQTRACYDVGVTVAIDANQHKTRTTRDAYGRVVKVEEYTGTFTTCETGRGTPYATTTYTYDRLGNLLTVTDALGNQTTLQYDTLSRKTQMRDPDLGTWTYQYDLNGNLTKQTDMKNQSIHFRYDSLNRRVQKDYGTQKALGAGDVRYTYDGSSYRRQGRLAKVVDSSGTTAFRYDVAGRVTQTDKTVDSVTYTTQTAYDGLGRVTSLTYPDASVVTYTYSGPQLQSVQEGTTTYARYSGFNALGQPGTLTWGNGATTTYTYDGQNYRLKSLETVHGPTTFQDLDYTFDKGGNVTEITDPHHGTQTFSYDALDRLTQATNAATGGYGTIDYKYNKIGNVTKNSKVGLYTYNTSGASSTRPHAVASTRLTAGSTTTTTTYSYDANGNLVSGGGRTLTWDYENRPTQIVKGGVTTTFKYDGDGGRVKKTVSTAPHATVYIGQLYVCEGTACTRLIYAGSQRVAMVQVNSGATSYFHGDHLGSTSALTDSTGTEEERNSYRPYGALQTHTGTSDVAYKYTGQERDASTDLYFYQARYYDPVLGRFLSPDTYVQNPVDPQTLNRYAYARNNPILYTDPSGHWIFVVIGAIIGGVSAGIASDWDIGAVLTGAIIGGVTGGVGGEVGGVVGAAVGKSYGPLAGFGAGGLAGGAAAGATSGVLYRLAGYNVNIGLAIAAGAGGGLTGGILGFGVGDLLKNATAGFVAGAASAGAISSTIAGADPGVGTLYAIAAAGLAYSFPSIRANLAKVQEYLDNKTKNIGIQLVSSQADEFSPGCHGKCDGVSGQLRDNFDSLVSTSPRDPYYFDVVVDNPNNVEIQAFRAVGRLSVFIGKTNSSSVFNNVHFALSRDSQVLLNIYGPSNSVPKGRFVIPFYVDPSKRSHLPAVDWGPNRR